jgi:hypothetical protein
MNDRPGIELKGYEAEGKLSGVMVFHLQERAAPDGRWHWAGEDRAALLTPRIEATRSTLRFNITNATIATNLAPTSSSVWS